MLKIQTELLSGQILKHSVPKNINDRMLIVLPHLYSYEIPYTRLSVQQ